MIIINCNWEGWKESNGCSNAHVNEWYYLARCTPIEFAKFGVETVLMGKTCNFDSNLSDFNSVDTKKAQKLSKANFFSKAKFEVQRPKF